MSVKTIKEIIQNTTSGDAGYLNKYINWVIPMNSLSKGVYLLKEKNAICLKQLIKFNFELRSTLLNDVFMAEAFLSTRLFLIFKNKKIGKISESLFASERQYKTFMTELKTFYKDGFETKKMEDYLNSIAFGKKVELTRLLDSLVIYKHILNEKKINKKEFLTAMKSIVSLRNRLSHNTFVSTKDIFYSKTIIQKRPSDEELYLSMMGRFDKVFDIFGEKGTAHRITKVCKKYISFLDFKKYNRDFYV